MTTEIKPMIVTNHKEALENASKLIKNDSKHVFFTMSDTKECRVLYAFFDASIFNVYDNYFEVEEDGYVKIYFSEIISIEMKVTKNKIFFKDMLTYNIYLESDRKIELNILFK